MALSRPRASPPSVVSADRLSTLALIRGEHGFSRARTRVRKASWTASGTPSRPHRVEESNTVLLGGKSFGK
jgi:hypothetical protein